MALTDFDVSLWEKSDEEIILSFSKDQSTGRYQPISEYEIIVFDNVHEADISVEGLTLRKDIYGDELIPIIMYLQTEQDTNIELRVSLVKQTLMELDDYTLIGLDSHSLTWMDQYSKQTVDMSLVHECDIESNSILSPEDPLDIRLLCDLTIPELQVLFDCVLSSAGLECSADVTAYAVLYSDHPEVIKLGDSVDEIIQSIKYLRLDDRSLFAYNEELLTDLDDLLLSEMDIIRDKMLMTNSVLSSTIESLAETGDSIFQIQHSAEFYQEKTIEINGNLTMSMIASPISVDSNNETELPITTLKVPIHNDGIGTNLTSTVKTETGQLPLVSDLDYKEFLMEFDYSELIEMDEALVVELDGAEDVIDLNVDISLRQFDISLSIACEMSIYPTWEYYDERLIESMDQYIITTFEGEIEQY